LTSLLNYLLKVIELQSNKQKDNIWYEEGFGDSKIFFRAV